jgi:hypothetical protein
MRALLSRASKLLAGAGVCAAWTEPAVAEETEAPAAYRVDIHGFVSQGFIKTTANNYLADSEDGSFSFTEVGINFSSALSENLRVGLQLFARDLGPLGNYKPVFDWYFLDYRFLDELGIRVGRTKLPFGLYNENSDIDAARVPILLPQSVYPTRNRDLLLAQTGGELYGLLQLGDAGELEYRAYGGTIHVDVSEQQEITNVEIPYVYGGRLMWQTPLDGLQGGVSLQKLRLDVEYDFAPETTAPLQAAGLLPADFDGRVALKAPVLLWVASLEYSAHELLLASEYGRWVVDVESTVPALVPESDTISERFYVMASYRVSPWFTPGAYYSLYYPDVEKRDGRAARQHDLALSFRYDLNEHWLLKLEGHYMSGTAGLNRALNDGAALDTLRKEWGVLLIKTTAYF